MVDKKMKYYEGVGRRKTSVARVRIYEGSDITIINGKDPKEYFGTEYVIQSYLTPMIVTNLLKKFGYSVKVSGGGVNGQVGAIKLGLARALMKYDITLRKVLKENGMVTRDPRMVERKKYFLRKARKSPQYSKR